MVEIAIDEVGNHLYFVADVKFLVSLVAQVLRYRSYTIALLDGEAGDWQIRAIEADKSDVRPVQGGYERQSPGTLGKRGDHLLGQQCTYRVRNRVVNMQQVERIKLGHFRHPGRKRQVIRRIVEERIMRDLHFMEEDIRLILTQSKRLR